MMMIVTSFTETTGIVLKSTGHTANGLDLNPSFTISCSFGKFLNLTML